MAPVQRHKRERERRLQKLVIYNSCTAGEDEAEVFCSYSGSYRIIGDAVSQAICQSIILSWRPTCQAVWIFSLEYVVSAQQWLHAPSHIPTYWSKFSAEVNGVIPGENLAHYSYHGQKVLARFGEETLSRAAGH